MHSAITVSEKQLQLTAYIIIIIPFLTKRQWRKNAAKQSHSNNLHGCVLQTYQVVSQVGCLVLQLFALLLAFD